MRLALFAGSVLLSSAFLRTPQPAVTPAVTGMVFDSLSMTGLGGATVQLVTVDGRSAMRTTRSTASGHFTFLDVPVGSYLLGFLHPKLDSLGLNPETKRLDIRVDQPLQTQLSIPSGRTIARSVCGASFVTEEAGLLLGFVRGSGNAMPRAGANVVVRWADIVVEKGGVRREVSTTSATSNGTGQFAVCGVPLNVPVLINASVEADSSGQFEVTVPGSAFLNRDVFVAPISRLRVRSLDSMPDVQLLRGTGRLRGRVIGANKRIVRDARVTVWGTGVETTTNPDGEFSLANLPAGTHTLEVRAIGFSPAQIPVDIMDEQASAEVELSAIAVTLDTVRVTAQRAFVSRRLLEIERRQRSGMGHVLTAQEINKRNPWRLTDLLRTVPGIRMTPGRFTADVVRMRNKFGLGYCTPDFYVDNIRVLVDEDFPIDNVVPMDDVMAVEVYTNMVPGDFFASRDCGVVAITTGGRPAAEKR